MKIITYGENSTKQTTPNVKPMIDPRPSRFPPLTFMEEGRVIGLFPQSGPKEPWNRYSMAGYLDRHPGHAAGFILRPINGAVAVTYNVGNGFDPRDQYSHPYDGIEYVAFHNEAGLQFLALVYPQNSGAAVPAARANAPLPAADSIFFNSSRPAKSQSASKYRVWSNTRIIPSQELPFIAIAATGVQETLIEPTIRCLNMGLLSGALQAEKPESIAGFTKEQILPLYEQSDISILVTAIWG